MKNLKRIQNSLGRGFYLSGFILLFAFIFASCENETELTIPLSGKPELSVAQENVVLNQKQAKNDVLNVAWSRGSNQGTGAAIDYTLEVAPSGTTFNDPFVLDLGRVIYSYEFNTADLNELLTEQFGLATGEETTIELRVKTVVADDAVEPEYSNVASVKITPYEPVTETLYLLGDATANGWDAALAAALTANNNDPTVFTYSGNFSAGEFKFITTLGEFLPSYNRADAAGTMLTYRTESTQPDDLFMIPQAGVYQITVDLVDLTISIAPLDEPPFANIYIVGDASPSGWNIDTPEAFTQDPDDPFIFTYEGLFSQGSFKILAGQTGDWCGEWYRPLVNGQDLSLNDVEQNSGCDVDNTWSVTDVQAGVYKITLDTRAVSVNIEEVNLYMVGDAGPNGWNIADPAPMTKTGAVYTYTGPLLAGEFKIAKFTGDWCDGDWINAATAGQSISNTNYITTTGCDGPDNKWVVTSAEARDYEVKVDLAAGAMTITPQ